MTENDLELLEKLYVKDGTTYILAYFPKYQIAQAYIIHTAHNGAFILGFDDIKSEKEAFVKLEEAIDNLN